MSPRFHKLQPVPRRLPSLVVLMPLPFGARQARHQLRIRPSFRIHSRRRARRMVKVWLSDLKVEMSDRDGDVWALAGWAAFWRIPLK